MPMRTLAWRYLLLLVAGGCTPSPPPRGVVRPDPMNYPKAVEGPMPGFGPFESFSDALLAACPLILSQPRATAGRRGEQGFKDRWRVSSEYCAWLYYTPDNHYEMSMLVESIDPLPSSEEEERTCRLPTFVDDKRYPPQLLKHVYILHNHPSPITLSDRDVRAIATAARIHGKFVETRDGRIPVSIIAFFSNSYNPSQPTCDGFFEYSIATTDLWKWTPDEKGKWQREKMGTITWSDGQVYRFQSR